MQLEAIKEITIDNNSLLKRKFVIDDSIVRFITFDGGDNETVQKNDFIWRNVKTGKDFALPVTVDPMVFLTGKKAVLPPPPPAPVVPAAVNPTPTGPIAFTASNGLNIITSRNFPLDIFLDQNESVINRMIALINVVGKVPLPFAARIIYQNRPYDLILAKYGETGFLLNSNLDLPSIFYDSGYPARKIDTLYKPTPQSIVQDTAWSNARGGYPVTVANPAIQTQLPNTSTIDTIGVAMKPTIDPRLTQIENYNIALRSGTIPTGTTFAQFTAMIPALATKPTPQPLPPVSSTSKNNYLIYAGIAAAILFLFRGKNAS